MPEGLCGFVVVVVSVIPFQKSNNFISEKAYEEENLCWWILTGLVKSFLFFMGPFHFLSACPCECHLICCPANVPCGRHSGTYWGVSIFP